VAHQEDVLRIPNAALRFRPEGVAVESPEKAKKVASGSQVSDRGKARTGPTSVGNQGRPGRVWTLAPEGKVVSVPIVLGITDGSFSQIISGDLKEGTEVIVEQMAKGSEQNRGTASPFGIRK
jgi:HlyD family secretion protein